MPGRPTQSIHSFEMREIHSRAQGKTARNQGDLPKIACELRNTMNQDVMCRNHPSMTKVKKVPSGHDSLGKNVGVQYRGNKEYKAKKSVYI